MTILQSALKNLPENASEAVVDNLFATPLLRELGFETEEVYPQYDTGDGKVDKAARKTIGDDIFLHTQSNPFLLVELKGKDINLSGDSPDYQKTVKQLKKYLLAPNCQTVQWGIITNSCHIQLFRKHGKIIYPATKCLQIDLDNIENIVGLIRNKIDRYSKGITIAVYNNKGGVGKTTTTVNLAAILTFLEKKVLVVDLDFNQQDLTKYLGIPLSQGNVFQALTERDINLKNTISPYTFRLKTGKKISFDVIPGDSKITEVADHISSSSLKINDLHQKLGFFQQEYDYILIDSPPNWRLFSKMAVYAADVVLIPTKHNSFFSLENAAIAIKKFIPEVQEKKDDGTPIALPIFFNGEEITSPQLKTAQDEIDNIIKLAQKEDKFDLLPYFYPRYTSAKKNLHIHQVPSYAWIANAAFDRIPAVFKNKLAHEYYKNLAKEYFLP